MFELHETMVGAYTLTSPSSHPPPAWGAKPLSLSLRWHARSLMAALRQGVSLSGQVDAEGLADARPLSGSVTMPERHQLIYRFSFEDNDGDELVLQGRRRLTLGGLPAAITVVEGHMTRRGAVLAHACLRLDVRAAILQLMPRV